MTTLIQKLRDATSGSAELDLEIWALVGGWKLVTQPDSIEMRAEKYDGDVVSEWETVAFWDSYGHVRVYHAFEEDLPRYSRSLDAIIGLIEEKGQHVRYISWHRFPAAESAVNACVGKTRAESKSAVHVDAVLALNLALLSALEGES